MNMTQLTFHALGATFPFLYEYMVHGIFQI